MRNHKPVGAITVVTSSFMYCHTDLSTVSCAHSHLHSSHPKSPWVITHEMMAGICLFPDHFLQPSHLFHLLSLILPSEFSLSLSPLHHIPFASAGHHQPTMYYRWAHWSWLQIQSAYCNHSWVNTAIDSLCVCMHVWHTTSTLAPLFDPIQIVFFTYVTVHMSLSFGHFFSRCWDKLTCLYSPSFIHGINSLQLKLLVSHRLQRKTQNRSTSNS